MAGSDILDVQLIHYFTCGPDEGRAWTIRDGTLAPKAAGVIQYVLFPPFEEREKSRINRLTFCDCDYHVQHRL